MITRSSGPWFLRELPLFLITAVATHLVMSFAQTLMHCEFAHHPLGGLLFRALRSLDYEAVG